MGAFRSRCAIVAAAVALTAGLGRLGRESGGPAAWEAETAADRPAPEVVALRMMAKRRVAEDVAAGRRPLAEAAALFGILNRLPPAVSDTAWLADDPPPAHPAAATAEGRLCRQVIIWARVIMRETEPEREGAVAARLEAEFRRAAGACGAIRLPNPEALESAEEMLDRCRSRLPEFWHGRRARAGR